MAASLLFLVSLAQWDQVDFSHLSRFPTVEYSTVMCHWLEARREWLRQEGQAQPFGFRSEWYTSECDRCFQLWYTWDCLRYAQVETNPVGQRMQWLRVLRERIGKHNYGAGVMPE